ncbi:dienelactone hydrolase family protein [Nocardia farcinica]|uniref:dienelactone hydrolase family protein n=1 Tax=Nocardia farcinica TaxID=37329 RepID=UPI003CC7CB72
MASVALFLASDDSRYVTGIDIKVDGGQTIGFSANFGADEAADNNGPSNVALNRELREQVRPTDVIEISTNDGVAAAYVFTPGGRTDDRWPGVLLYSDVMGVRPVFMVMAQTIADLGFTVLLPRMFYRSGAPLDPPLSARNTAHLPTLLARASLVTREKLEEDSRGYLAALRGLAARGAGGGGGGGFWFFTPRRGSGGAARRGCGRVRYRRRRCAAVGVRPGRRGGRPGPRTR